MENNSNKEPGLPITIETSHSHILTVDLLGQEDSNTAKRFSESAAQAGASAGSNTYSHYVKIHNLPMLENLLSSLARDASKLNNPLIFLDGHGCPIRGLSISSVGHYMSWQELQNKLKEINKKTKNTTGVVISTCYGMLVSSGITFDSISPFQYCIAPTQVIPTHVVDDKIPKFLNTMLESRSMTKALSHLRPNYETYLSHEYFYSHFISHLRKYSRGSGARKVIEEITTLLHEQQPPSRKDIGKARQIAKKTAKDQKRHYDRIAKIFLGENKILPFETISDYVERWYKS